MKTKAYIDGFIYKCAKYGIDPEAIYGKFSLEDPITPLPYSDNALIYPIGKKPKFDFNKWLETSKFGRAALTILRNKYLYGPKFMGISYSRSF